jgi:hypothetical protein
MNIKPFEITATELEKRLLKSEQILQKEFYRVFIEPILLRILQLAKQNS